MARGRHQRPLPWPRRFEAALRVSFIAAVVFARLGYDTLRYLRNKR